MNAAEACFILAARNYNDRSAAVISTIIISRILNNILILLLLFKFNFNLLKKNRTNIRYFDHGQWEILRPLCLNIFKSLDQRIRFMLPLLVSCFCFLIHMSFFLLVFSLYILVLVFHISVQTYSVCVHSIISFVFLLLSYWCFILDLDLVFGFFIFLFSLLLLLFSINLCIVVFCHTCLIIKKYFN